MDSQRCAPKPRATRLTNRQKNSTLAQLSATRQSSLQHKNLAISLMTAVRVPSLCGFKGIFSAMLQISCLVVGHEFDDTRP